MWFLLTFIINISYLCFKMCLMSNVQCPKTWRLQFFWLTLDIGQRPWFRACTGGGGILLPCILWKRKPTFFFVFLKKMYVSLSRNKMVFFEYSFHSENLTYLVSCNLHNTLYHHSCWCFFRQTLLDSVKIIIFSWFLFMTTSCFYVPYVHTKNTIFYFCFCFWNFW